MKPKIKPKINYPVQNSSFNELNVGDTFLYDDELWMKTDDDEQSALCLNDGAEGCGFCNPIIRQVDVEITWKRTA